MRPIRSLLREPGLCAIVTLTAALGICTTTVVYSIVYAILLRPFPYADPGQLVRVQTRHLTRGNALGGMSLLDLDDYRRLATTIESIGAFFTFENQLLGDGAGEVAVLTQLNPSTLNALGVAPVVGRLFSADEDRPGGDVHKTLISHALWQSRFGADPDIVGKPLRTDRVTYTIVGVMPAGFAFPQRSGFWSPMESWYATLPDDRAIKKREQHTYATIARVKRGVTLAQAEADLNLIAEALERQFPTDNEGVRIKLTPLREFETGELRPYLALLAAGVGFVLLVCCANIAGLLLLRAEGQRRRLAIQAALGAGRSRVVREQLGESMVLALAGGSVGIAMSYAALGGVLALIPVRLPFWMTIEIDRWVLAFSVALTVATGVVFGLAPAIQASRLDVHRVLKDGGRGSPRSRLRAALVVAEVGFSLLLLVCAALLTRTLIHLQRVERGFNASGVITVRTVRAQPPATTLRQTAALLNERHARTIATLEAIPGVAAAAVTNGLPFTGTVTERGKGSFSIRGRVDVKAMVPYAGSDVSGGYFRTMEIPLLRGRLFDDSDTPSSPMVAIVNERAAKVLWNGGDPIGQDILWGPESPANPYCRVVGIVGNIRQQAGESADGIEIYYPSTQWPIANGYYVIRTRGDPDALADTIRRTIEVAEPQASVAELKTMDRRIADSLWQRRLWGVLFVAFGTMALVLAAVGLYGVVSYSVAQRAQEIGIRMALGAAPLGVAAMVLREALTLGAIGVTLGLAGALAMSRAMSSLLNGVAPHDPLTLAAVAGVLCATAAAAAWIPAHRAARIDPVAALRGD
jgi:putative ABC transport system permease protein